MTKKIVVIEGDDASPEAMQPTVEVISSLGLDIAWQYPVVGEDAIEKFGTPLPQETKDMIDASDSTLFGSTSGKTGAALGYLRWGRLTYANCRPTKYLPGYQSPLADPTGIDFVIVRENLEDLYLGIEGDVEGLANLGLRSRTARMPLAEYDGRYAIKVITEEGSTRIVRKAFELARARAAKGLSAKVTCTAKYNMLSYTDGLFRDCALKVAAENPDIEFETFIVDDFAHRLCARPQDFDVIVMPNLYGDILSDAAAGLVGGLGLAASGCYGDDYAYFESAHGTAPDIAGQNIINPTATLISAAMMLEYLDFNDASERLLQGIETMYADRLSLTPDQGGKASTTDFCRTLTDLISN
ncbi:MAG: hypothetical protein KUG79_19670 [Pseudomonadales bacterium]|nr:hypothetical protein [Pseudomonadales bacterium]